MLLPGETVELEAQVDNQHCSRKILRYTVRLLQRLLVLEPGKRKPLHSRDRVVDEQELTAECDAGQSETKVCKIELPHSFYMNDQEKAQLPAIPKEERALSYGPSSTISGKRYRVQYYVEFYTKHQGLGNAL